MNTVFSNFIVSTHAVAQKKRKNETKSRFIASTWLVGVSYHVLFMLKILSKWTFYHFTIMLPMMWYLLWHILLFMLFLSYALAILFLFEGIFLLLSIRSAMKYKFRRQSVLFVNEYNKNEKNFFSFSFQNIPHRLVFVTTTMEFHFLCLFTLLLFFLFITACI